jgi:hypothetical protein
VQKTLEGSCLSGGGGISGNGFLLNKGILFRCWRCGIRVGIGLMVSYLESFTCASVDPRKSATSLYECKCFYLSYRMIT